MHWHGIELDSYFDGVPGFSGSGRRVTPLIMPRDSFEVRFTPPRAGTFIYHTHADEQRQQLAGLAGALIVREPGHPWNPALDMPLLFTESADSAGRATRVLVNGQAAPHALELRAGTRYRFRFIQMSVSRSALRFELLREGATLTWTPVAKDGAELPATMRVASTSRARLGIGETYDVEFTPLHTGDQRLEVSAGLRWSLPSPLLLTIPITVRAAATR